MLDRQALVCTILAILAIYSATKLYSVRLEVFFSTVIFSAPLNWIEILYEKDMNIMFASIDMKITYNIINEEKSLF